MKKLFNYQKSKTEKLDSVQTSVSIERRHKVFVEQKNINLSKVVRDALDILINETTKELKNEKKS